MDISDLKLGKIAGAGSILLVAFGVTGFVQNFLILNRFGFNISSVASNADIIGGAFLSAVFVLCIGFLILLLQIFLGFLTLSFFAFLGLIWPLISGLTKCVYAIFRRVALRFEKRWPLLKIGKAPKAPDFFAKFHFFNVLPWLLDFRLISIVVLIVTFLMVNSVNSRVEEILSKPFHLIADGFNPNICYGVVARLSETTILVELGRKSPEGNDVGLSRKDNPPGENRPIDQVGGASCGPPKQDELWRTVRIQTSLIKALVSSSDAMADAPPIIEGTFEDDVLEALQTIPRMLNQISEKIPQLSGGDRGLSAWTDVGVISEGIDQRDGVSVDDRSPNVYWIGFEPGLFSDVDVAKRFLSGYVVAPELNQNEMDPEAAALLQDVDRKGRWRLERKVGLTDESGYSLSEIADAIREDLNDMQGSQLPLWVELLGYADETGAYIDNLTLSSFRAAVVEGQVRKELADEVAQGKIKTIHCFVGENWYGAHDNPKTDSWLRRVEIRWGDRIITGSNCAPAQATLTWGAASGRSSPNAR